MNRNNLELKSIKITPEKVQTLAAAKRLAKLKDFELKEEFFEPKEDIDEKKSHLK